MKLSYSSPGRRVYEHLRTFTFNVVLGSSVFGSGGATSSWWSSFLIGALSSLSDMAIATVPCHEYSVLLDCGGRSRKSVELSCGHCGFPLAATRESRTMVAGKDER